MAPMLVAMSGGVDSSVAAALMVSEGHEVVGATMKLWGGDGDSGCCAVSDVEDARRVADHLGIEHHVFNFGEDFERHVVGPYVADHAAARTPNPCIECNRTIKFDKFFRRARALGFDAVVTGHHARRVRSPDGTYRVARGRDGAKDQSYVLYTLTGAALGSVRFPIGEMTKAEVRAAAAGLGLRTAAKPESQDVCFVTRAAGRAAFLGDRIPLHPAPVVDAAGRTVGRVDALETVTVGQRRNLGLPGGTDRRFVVGVDPSRRVVTVGSQRDLLRGGVELERLVWASGPCDGPVTIQTSAHGAPVPAVVAPIHDGRAAVTFERPQRTVASGQSVVIYDGDVVVGGGVAR